MAVTGMVQTDAGHGGQARLRGNVANSYVTSAATFSQWYRDTSGVNHTTAGTLTLWSNGKGAYVNRYGPNGEQWIVTAPAYYCGNVGEEMMDADHGHWPFPARRASAPPTATRWMRWAS